MYAQRRPKREQRMLKGNLFYCFGNRTRAEQGSGDGVSEVEVSVDPTFGSYWGWIPRLGDAPIYISDCENDLIRTYSQGDLTRSIDRDQAAGLGRVVRLYVKELAADPS